MDVWEGPVVSLRSGGSVGDVSAAWHIPFFTAPISITQPPQQSHHSRESVKYSIAQNDFATLLANGSLMTSLPGSDALSVAKYTGDVDVSL